MPAVTEVPGVFDRGRLEAVGEEGLAGIMDEYAQEGMGMGFDLAERSIEGARAFLDRSAG